MSKSNNTLFYIYALVASIFLLMPDNIKAQNLTFAQCFSDSTLRLDYIFSGDRDKQYIALDQLTMTPNWYGRKKRLSDLPLEGNGQITVSDPSSGEILYRHSFSTLFQEWLSTEESKNTQKAFENVFLIPFPLKPVDIKVELLDFHRLPFVSMTHRVDPNDILIRKVSEQSNPYVTLQQARDTSNCIHIAYVAEGYTKQETDSFLSHAKIAMEALFSHEPFKSLQSDFNIIAVPLTSPDSGVSQPSDGIWRQTALSSHFDTFYSVRYLTTLRLKALHDALSCLPYEHIIILANTDHYGGGGIYNSYTLSYTKGKYFQPVVVHEFGHSFAGLADEYDYGDDDPMYFADTEPWEMNITTQHDFSQKWSDLIADGKASLIEGGGYQSKGVWRGCPDCRMKTNTWPEFCPVCQQAIINLIMFYLAE